MDKDTMEWQVSNAEFRGYMKASVDEIKHALADLKSVNEQQQILINKNRDYILSLKTKSAIFGAVAGFVASVLLIIVSFFMGGPK